MQRIDSLKLEFSKELMFYDAKNFNKTTKEIEDVETSFSKLKEVHKKTGLKDIIIKDNSCILEMSSKLVPDSYYDMMNINTIEQYLSEINNTGLIQFNPKSVIENSQVLSCDVTNNIPGIMNVSSYINPLIIYKVNDKYICKLYKNQTITFNKDVKDKKNGTYLKLYDKYDELVHSRSKKGKEFLNYIDAEKFKNVLRVESRFSSFKTIRKAFNISNQNLLTVFNSKENINYNIFNHITNIKNIDAATFTNYKSLTQMREYKSRSYIEKRAGMIQIIKMLNYDIGLIRMFINTGSTANNSAIIKEYKSLIKSMIDEENNIHIDKKVDEIKQWLKVA